MRRSAENPLVSAGTTLLWSDLHFEETQCQPLLFTADLLLIITNQRAMGGITMPYLLSATSMCRDSSSCRSGLVCYCTVLAQPLEDHPLDRRLELTGIEISMS